jgi:hypothetical protein
MDAHGNNMIDFDAVIPRSKVIETAIAFLRSTGFRLQIEEDKWVTIPRSADLVLWTRSFIKQEDAETLLGDHYEATVMLGRLDGGNCPDIGYLRLYFNSDGEFVREDVYPRYWGQYHQAPEMMTTLISSPNPSFVGQTVTFNAEVTNSIQVPTPNGDKVTFKSGKKVLAVVALNNSVARFTTASLKPGSHRISAKYCGPYAASQYARIKQAVNKYTTKTTLVSIRPSDFGQLVILTATVTGAGPSPTGTVAFKDGTLRIGLATLREGVAHLSKIKLAVGTHAITAQYLGDRASAKSVSAVLGQVVRESGD